MGLWRTDDPVLDEKGIVRKGGMTAPQREWWALPNFVRLLVGGYGSGKSLSLCKRMTSLALENSPHPVAIVSPTYPMAQETVIETTRQLLGGKATLMPSFRWSEKKGSPHEFRLFHGDKRGRILVYTGEHPKRLKGPNLAAAGIDEPFIQDKEVFEQMVARVRAPGSRRRELNLTGTPEDLNWGYELAEGELGERYDVGIVRASTHSNVALPSDYVERLEAGFDAKTADAYLRGEFVSLSKGAVYHAFDADNNVIDLDKPDDAVWFSGWDFNVNPLSCVVGWVLHPDDVDRAHLHIVAEYEFPNADTEFAAGAVLEEWGSAGLALAYPDSNVGRATNAPAGVTDHDYLRAAGFHVVPHPGGNPAIRDRVNTVNGMLSSMRHGTRMTISPACVKLRRYLSSYAHEKMNTTHQKSMSHLLDAATYPVSTMFGPKAGRAGVAKMRVA